MASAIVRPACAGLVAACGLACASAKLELIPSELPPRPEGALEVQLSFDGAADLDLHVTDPRLETVYFGNSPSRGGGRLDRDVRCEADAGEGERSETVRFDTPLAGRYRVGVDYVSACRRFRREARYLLRVIGPGLDLERTGRVVPGHFDHKALEFDWPPPGSDSALPMPAPAPAPAPAPTPDPSSAPGDSNPRGP